MITTEQFEHKLIEYLDGELSDAEKREVEEYLQAHPEAIELKGDFSLLCAAGRSIRESTFSAELLLEANRKLAARLADSRPENVVPIPVASHNGSPETTPSRTWLPNWRRRFRPPVLAAVLAALAILLVGAVTQRAALADIASSLLQRMVVTFNDEPLSDSQQQVFDDLVEITETLDENGDPVVSINLTPENLTLENSTADQFLQELADGGLLKVEVSGDESSEAVSSDSGPIMWLRGVRISRDVVNDSLAAEVGNERWPPQYSVRISRDVVNDSLAAEVGNERWPPQYSVRISRGVVNDSLHTHTALDSLRSAKIGSQSLGVAEDQSWGDIKKAAGSTTDDSP